MTAGQAPSALGLGADGAGGLLGPQAEDRLLGSPSTSTPKLPPASSGTAAARGWRTDTTAVALRLATVDAGAAPGVTDRSAGHEAGQRSATLWNRKWPQEGMHWQLDFSFEETAS